MRNDDRGSMSLVELAVVTGLATTLLVVVALTAGFASKSAALANSTSNASRRVDTALTSAISTLPGATSVHGCIQLAHPAPGQPANFSAPTFSVPLSKCAVTAAVQPSSSAPSPLLAVATTPGLPQGLCWLAAESSASGLVAPDLRCLVAYPDGEMWSFDWQPIGGATYTSCNPASCYGPTAPQPGSLPPEPTKATGSYATFAGRTAVSSVDGCPTFRPPFAISTGPLQVTVTVTEGFGPDLRQQDCPLHPVGHGSYQSVNYTANIGGNGGDQWNSI